MKKLILIKSISLCFLFTNLLNAQITSVSPDTAIQGQLLDIDVTADNINFTQGTNVIYFKQGGADLYVNNTTVNSATSITLHQIFSADNPIGYYDLSVWNTSSGPTYLEEDAVYLKAGGPSAQLDSISPNQAKQGEVITVRIYGYNTNFSENGASNNVYLSNGASGQIQAASVTPLGGDTLEVEFNFTYAYSSGIYNLTVINSYDGTLNLPNSFRLLVGDNPPAILTVSPEFVVQGESLDIEVTAENVDFTQGTNVVKFILGDVQVYANSTTVQNATSLSINQFFNSSHPIGDYDLSIWNTSSDITLVKDEAIYVEVDPTTAVLDSIKPNLAKQGDNITITVYGTNTNFDSEEGPGTVILRGAAEEIDATYINTIDSVSFEADFEFAYAHDIGVYDIFVTNSLDGTIRLNSAFELYAGDNVPAITSVTPDTAIRGSSLDIEVTAENVDFTQGTNVVYFIQGNTELQMDDVTVNGPTSLSITQTFTITDALGYYNLSIWHPQSDLTVLKEDAIFVIKSGLIAINDVQERVIDLYPNPASDYIYIREEYDNIQLFDVNGRLMFETQQSNKIDVSNLKNGLYFVVARSGEDILVEKVIVE